jgi:hypothetical protein
MQLLLQIIARVSACKIDYIPSNECELCWLERARASVLLMNEQAFRQQSGFDRLFDKQSVGRIDLENGSQGRRQIFRSLTHSSR